MLLLNISMKDKRGRSPLYYVTFRVSGACCLRVPFFDRMICMASGEQRITVSLYSTLFTADK